MSKSPCHGCAERYIGCHAKCERYLAWCAVREKEKARIREAKAEEDRFIEYAVKQARRRTR